MEDWVDNRSYYGRVSLVSRHGHRIWYFAVQGIGDSWFFVSRQGAYRLLDVWYALDTINRAEENFLRNLIDNSFLPEFDFEVDEVDLAYCREQNDSVLN